MPNLYLDARLGAFLLQEQGKLRAFWNDWLATRGKDPTAAAALQRALGTEDLAAFQKRWEKWVGKQRR